MCTAQDLLTELNASDESPRIGAKRALANAVMHRSYQDHSPIQIVRYNNRIEILNPGFWLKDMASLGTPGSRMRTLQASNVLRSLRDRGLLEKQGASNRTHYALANLDPATGVHPEQGERPLEGGKRAPVGGKQASEGGKCNLPPLPPELAQRLPAPGKRMGEMALRQLIRDLCGWHPIRGEELATFLTKDLKYLRNRHLSAMVQSGELVFQYPESPNHHMQACKLPKSP